MVQEYKYNPTRFTINAQIVYTINNLQQDTTYSITVSILNGVSDQDADNAKLRECSIVVTTMQGSMFDQCTSTIAINYNVFIALFFRCVHAWRHHLPQQHSSPH